MSTMYIQFGIGNNPFVYDRSDWHRKPDTMIEDTELYTINGNNIIMVKTFIISGNGFHQELEEINGVLESKYVSADNSIVIYSDDLADVRSLEDLERVVKTAMHGGELAGNHNDDAPTAKTTITGNNLFGWVLRLDVDPVAYKVALDKSTLSVYPIHTNGVHAFISNLSIEESSAPNIDDIVPLTIEDYDVIKYGIMFMIMSKHTHLMSSVNCKMVIPGITKENYTEWSSKFRRAIYRNKLSDVLPEGSPYALYDKVLFT